MKQSKKTTVKDDGNKRQSRRDRSSDASDEVTSRNDYNKGRSGSTKRSNTVKASKTIDSGKGKKGGNKPRDMSLGSSRDSNNAPPGKHDKKKASKTIGDKDNRSDAGAGYKSHEIKLNSFAGGDLEDGDDDMRKRRSTNINVLPIRQQSSIAEAASGKPSDTIDAPGSSPNDVDNEDENTRWSGRVAVVKHPLRKLVFEQREAQSGFLHQLSRWFSCCWCCMSKR